MKPASETFELTETAAPDRLGSVVTLYRHNPLRETDPNSIVDQYTYDAYGNVSIDDIDNWYNGNQYMFTGRRYDSESGLYYYRARMYNPELGVFQSQDPMGYIDSMNLYAYCANNPLNFTDPMGEAVLGQNDREEYNNALDSAGEYGYENLDNDFNIGQNRLRNMLDGLRRKLRVLVNRSSKQCDYAIENIQVRNTRNGQKAIRITYENGNIKDVSRSRVKEYTVKTDHRAPKGTLQKVQFAES